MQNNKKINIVRKKKSNAPSKELVTKSQVRQMMQSKAKPLIKYVDTAWSYTMVNATYQFAQQIVMPTTGTGSNNMAGTRIKIDHLELRSQVYINGITNYGVYPMRTVIYQNKVPANPLVLADIFDESTTFLPIYAPFSYSEKDETFTPIFDRRFVASTLWKAVTLVDQLNIVPHVKECHYNSGSAEWNQGVPQLLFLFGANQNAGDNEAIYSGIVRTWFYDT